MIISKTHHDGGNTDKFFVGFADTVRGINPSAD